MLTKSTTRRPAALLAAIAAAPMLLPAMSLGSTPVEAKPSALQCYKQNESCIARCKRVYETPSRVQACFHRCDSKLLACIPANETQGKIETPPPPRQPKNTDNSTPPIGGNKDEPTKPSRPTGSVTPIGTKAEPKASSSSNDTRPPLGGGIFGTRTPSGGNSGPILLRTNGASQTGVKSGGASGSKSTNEKR